MEQDNCNELLDNIKASLHYCISNETRYNFNAGKGKFYPLKCENIKNVKIKANVLLLPSIQV